MRIIKDERHWKVKLILPNDECPYLFYPRNEHACRLLEDTGNELCTLENCPQKEQNGKT